MTHDTQSKPMEPITEREWDELRAYVNGRDHVLPKWVTADPARHFKRMMAHFDALPRATAPALPTDEQERAWLELAREITARIEGGSPIFSVGEARALATAVQALTAALASARAPSMDGNVMDTRDEITIAQAERDGRCRALQAITAHLMEDDSAYEGEPRFAAETALRIMNAVDKAGVHFMNEMSAPARAPWQPISTAPDSNGRPDQPEVWVYGGRRDAPERALPDGQYWRACRANGNKSAPTHWMPAEQRPAPPQGDEILKRIGEMG